MSDEFTSEPGRRGYHHGNLKEALIAAALELITAKGAAGFTVAEAARQAGVSPAAPYRHFRDRDMLLAEVARRGFDLFADRLSQGWNNGKPNPVAAVMRMGHAYLAFARSEPAHYAAMFEAGVAVTDLPECRQASDRALATLRHACDALVANAPAGARPPAMMMALHIWSLSHGVASLFARGDAARRSLPMAPEDLLEAGVLVYLDGLGIRAPR